MGRKEAFFLLLPGGCGCGIRYVPRSIEVRGLLCTLRLAELGAPALRFVLPEAGDAMLPAVPPPPAAAALPENSSRGLTLVAVLVMRPDTAIGCDSLCWQGRNNMGVSGEEGGVCITHKNKSHRGCGVVMPLI